MLNFAILYSTLTWVPVQKEKEEITRGIKFRFGFVYMKNYCIIITNYIEYFRDQLILLFRNKAVFEDIGTTPEGVSGKIGKIEIFRFVIRLFYVKQTFKY